LPTSTSTSQCQSSGTLFRQGVQQPREFPVTQHRMMLPSKAIWRLRRSAGFNDCKVAYRKDIVPLSESGRHYVSGAAGFRSENIRLHQSEPRSLDRHDINFHESMNQGPNHAAIWAAECCKQRLMAGRLSDENSVIILVRKKPA
jgi:hypothetical protein